MLPPLQINRVLSICIIRSTLHNCFCFQYNIQHVTTKDTKRLINLALHFVTLIRKPHIFFKRFVPETFDWYCIMKNSTGTKMFASSCFACPNSFSSTIKVDFHLQCTSHSFYSEITRNQRKIADVMSPIVCIAFQNIVCTRHNVNHNNNMYTLWFELPIPLWSFLFFAIESQIEIFIPYIMGYSYSQFSKFFVFGRGMYYYE